MPRHATPLTLGAVAAAATVLVVVLGFLVLGGSDDDVAGPPPEPRATPLAELDTLAAPVARAGFCAQVPDEAVTAALGGPAAEASSYDDGEPVRFTPRVTDIAHEFGCRWSRRGATARAWVFAPPVSPGAAEDLLADARTKGCRELADAPAFGEPGVALTCRTAKGPQVSFRGLFGDAWLVCTLTRRDRTSPVRQHAEDWCAAVLLAARAVADAG